MNKITYKRINYKNINEDFLKGYIRFQETYTVKYVDGDEIKQKEDYFVDDWDQKKLISICRELKDTVKEGGILYAAYDQKQIVGFALLDNNRWGDYINMSYIHAQKGYRGYGIGKYLFHLLSIEAIKLGFKKLYISTHPAIETQAFYKSVGCVMAEEINQTLYDIEPYDIQLEKTLDHLESVTELVDLAFKALGRVTATTIGKVATKLYRYLPDDDELFLEICKEFLEGYRYGYFSVSTLWLKRRTSILKPELMPFFEEILFTRINGWAEVDQYCYRLMNPMIELKDEFYDYLLKWSDSDNKDVRRASLVSMIRSSSKLTLEYDYDKMISLVEKLKTDSDFHVKKAVGWTLKCAYLKYPIKVENYLRENVNNLDRMIFRYALEHVEEPLRTELINL